MSARCHADSHHVQHEALAYLPARSHTWHVRGSPHFALEREPTPDPPSSNRAACFIQLGKEARAIKDAETTIELRPEWVKGYFRKGSALAGLRRWDDAVDSQPSTFSHKYYPPNPNP
jgi:tetratricopeptide (TPR) repeat protein